NITVILTWQPKNNDALLDPPPHCVKIYYRPYAISGVIVSTTGQNQSATASANGQCAGAAASCSRDTTPTNNYVTGSGASNPDADFEGEIMEVSLGTAAKD